MPRQKMLGAHRPRAALVGGHRAQQAAPPAQQAALPAQQAAHTIGLAAPAFTGGYANAPATTPAFTGGYANAPTTTPAFTGGYANAPAITPAFTGGYANAPATTPAFTGGYANAPAVTPDAGYTADFHGGYANAPAFTGGYANAPGAIPSSADGYAPARIRADSLSLGYSGDSQSLGYSGDSQSLGYSGDSQSLGYSGDSQSLGYSGQAAAGYVGPGARNGGGGAPAPARPAKYATKKMDENQGRALDASTITATDALGQTMLNHFHPVTPAAPGRTAATSSKTYYAHGDAGKRFDMSFGPGGRVSHADTYTPAVGGGPAPLTTHGAQAPRAIGSKANRFIYVMDGDGNFRAADPMAENTAAFDPQRGTGVKGNGKGYRVHHSTLVAGADVAGAGEIQARDGKVEVISDRSGHYMPDMGKTTQVVQELSERGVSPEALSVELSKKGKPGTPFGKDVSSSGLEMLGYQQALQSGEFTDGPAAEAKLRELHGQKDTAMGELQAVAAAQQGQLDSLRHGQNLRPSQMRNQARWRKR